MKARSLILLIIAAMLIGAIATCPAIFLRGTINANLAGTAQLENVEGSIWQGAGLLVFSNKQLPQMAVDWRFTPSLLASGLFGYALKINKNSTNANDIAGELIIGHGLRELQVRDATLRAPAATILPLLNPSLGFGVFTGQIAFRSKVVAITPSPTLAAAKVTGRATLNWRSANSFFLLGSAANEYVLDFDGNGAQTAFTLKTLSGPMTAEGQGTRVLAQMAPYNTVQFSGRAKLPQALLSRMGNLQSWLGQIGRMEGDQLVINWNGRL